MNNLPLDIQIHFFKVIGNEISVQVFEDWLYNNNDLEQHLGKDTYFKLISLNYKDKYLVLELRKIIDSYLDYGKFEERRLRKILFDLIQQTDDFMKSLINTYELYCSGYHFFDRLAFRYGLYLGEEYYDFSKWQNLTVTEKKNKIEEIYLEVKKEAEKILNWIDKQKIILTGEIDEINQYNYIDLRNNLEKNAFSSAKN